MVWFRIAVRDFSLLQNVQMGSDTHQWVVGVHILGGGLCKVSGVWNFILTSIQYSSEVKNVCYSYTSTSPYIFLVQFMNISALHFVITKCNKWIYLYMLHHIPIHVSITIYLYINIHNGTQHITLQSYPKLCIDCTTCTILLQSYVTWTPVSALNVLHHQAIIQEHEDVCRNSYVP
jgi:hypothetical protein